jgi:hypothetical protein
MAGILHAEGHRLRLMAIRSLDAASNPSALGAHEIALNVPTDHAIIAIVHFHVDAGVSGGLDTPLLIEQPLVDGLRWIVEAVPVALLVRLDQIHVEHAWRHGRQEPIEIVEVGLCSPHVPCFLPPGARLRCAWM